MLQPTNSTRSPESAVPPDGASALITERIRGEFREMPGLTLTVAQARRLWNVDLPTCTEVLSQLVDAGFLCCRSDGAYSRASNMTARPLRMAKAGIQFLEIDRPRRTVAEG
ncbi:MAG TPA: hypothetical protein VGZ27_12330 [Vicinamibacterales bacterium]|jgi:hypothetical protein|nr:hypothetical protein [Vicinamibacterales bacterium]